MATRRALPALLLFFAPLLLTAEWSQVSPYPAGPTDGCFSFVVDGTAYMGGGISNANLYAFNPQTGWRLVGPIPGNSMRAWSFVLVGETEVIVGGGDTTGSFAVTDEVFAFDPATETWSERSAFGGGARDGCWTFVIGDKGYVGSGFNGSGVVPDFWQYDFATDSWSQLASPLPPLLFASSFTIDGVGYVVGGWGGVESDLLFAFDAATGTWTQKASLPGEPRQAGVGFAWEGVGYYGAGMTGYTETFDDFYRYSPAEDRWEKLEEAYPEDESAWGSAFVIGDDLYVGTGAGFSSGSLTFTGAFYTFDLRGSATSVESRPTSPSALELW